MHAVKYKRTQKHICI